MFIIDLMVIKWITGHLAMTLKMDTEQDNSNNDYNGENSVDFLTVSRSTSIGELDKYYFYI